MATEKLNRRTLGALAPVDRPTTIFDCDLKGFGLRLMPPSKRNPSGARSWIVEYRPGSGGRAVAKRRIMLGSVGTLTPEQARSAAKDALAAVRLGNDPAAERAERRTAKRLADLEPIYSAETNPLRKDRTIELYSGYWRNHVLPAFGTSVARSISRADVVRFHRGLGQTQPVTANRCVTLLAHFYSWARDSGHVPADCNPTKGVDKFRESGRERFLTDAELTRLGGAMRLAETTGLNWPAQDQSKPMAKHAPKRPEVRRTIIDRNAVAALRLLLFTGARLREILHMRWTFADLSRGLLFLPDSKTGKKTVVLGAPAIAVLEELYATAVSHAKLTDPQRTAPDNEWVFPAAGGKAAKPDLKRPWAAITRAAGLNGLRIHDLRHTFASVGVGSGLGLPIIGGLLGHADAATTARYSHLADGPLQRAAGAISLAIDTALSAGEGVPTND